MSGPGDESRRTGESEAIESPKSLASKSRSGDPAEPTLFWRICRGIARLLATLLFEMRAYGLENVPRRGGVLLISNHQSYLDPVLLATFLRRQIGFLAKSELFENRYLSWLIRSLNAFPIRRGAGDVGAMKETIRKLRDGYGLYIFPEGHRTETGELLPIQPGAALVIRRAGVPVVPCIIQGSYRAWPRSQKLPRPRPIAIMYGPPLKTDGLKADEISQLIERTLHEMVAELRRIDRRIA
jgi:1-acyl-sn-glycerol-3-phosphate acyltransferase